MPTKKLTRSEVDMKIAAYLRQRRQRLGLTQAEAAKQLFMSTSEVAYLERCQRSPRLNTLLALLDLYGESLESMARHLDL